MISPLTILVDGCDEGGSEVEEEGSAEEGPG